MTVRTAVNCAQCGVTLDAHDTMHGEEVDELPPGAVIMCIYCGRCSLMGPAGPRVPTPEEYSALLDQRDVLDFIYAWLRVALDGKLPDPTQRGGRPRPKMIGPGAYVAEDGSLHFDLVQMCVWQGVKPTEANQEVVASSARRIFAEGGIAVVEERDDQSGRWT